MAQQPEKDAPCPVCGEPHAGGGHVCPAERTEAARRPPSNYPAPGTLLGGTYRLLAKRGEGGMGVVFEAEHVRLQRRVAVKILRPEYLRDADAVGRFCREARTAGRIHHEGIVEILDVNSEPDGTWYIAMELLSGTDLAVTLSRDGPLHVERAVDITRQVCAALAAAHAQGIVHRDVKPANVFLVDDDGHGDHVRLLDFGISKLVGAGTTVTGTGQIVGTPLYMSPEQACADPSLDHRADIFAVGAMLYEMLCGHAPFEAPTPAAVIGRLLTQEPTPVTQWRTGIPTWLDSAIRRCLARDPDHRYSSVSQLVSVLATGDAVLAPEAGPSAPSVAADEMRIVTVLFVNLTVDDAGETALSPEETAARLGPLLSYSRETIGRHGGSVLRQFPDGLMAVFGAPTARGDDAVRAVRAARDVREWCASERCDGRCPVSVRAGLSTGRVVAGKMRGSGDSGYGVVGQAVGLARRIEGVGREGAVLICGETFLQVRGRFKVRATGSLPAPDGTREIAMFEVVGEHPHGLLLQPREVLGARPAMVGRDAEFGQVVALFHRTLDDRSPQAVTVVGTAGMGKSRLAHELRCHVESLDFDVLSLHGRPSDMAPGSSLSLWANLIRAKTGVQGDEPLDKSMEKLRAFVRYVFGAEDLSNEHRVGTLAALLGLGPAAPGDQALPDRSLAVLLELLRHHASNRFPVLLVLDDIQWADKPSLAIAEQLLDRLAGVPVFVLSLARPELFETVPTFLTGRDCHVRIDLRPLSVRAGSQLVKEIIGGVAPAAFVARVASRAEGTPLFIEEILHVLAERGTLVSDGHQWRTAGDIGSLDVPMTVEAVLQARLDRLPPDERDCVRRAAVVGETFWDSALSALGVGEPEQVLGGLGRRDLVRQQPTSRFAGAREFAFRHALLRDVAYASIAPKERRGLHVLAAEWLESSGYDSLEGCLLAAHQFRAGGGCDKAARAYLRAGEAAMRCNAFADARNAYAAVQECGPAPQDADLTAKALRGLGLALERNGEFKEALPTLERAVDMAIASRREDLAVPCFVALARAYAATGEEQSAFHYLDLARLHAEAGADAATLLQIERTFSLAYYFAARHDDALASAERALVIAREARSDWDVAQSLHDVGCYLLFLGRHGEAEKSLLDSLHVARGSGYVGIVDIDETYLGLIDVVSHGSSSGVARIQQAVRGAETRGDHYRVAQGYHCLGRARLHLGDRPGARADFERCLPLAQQSGDRQLVAQVGGLLEKA